MVNKKPIQKPQKSKTFIIVCDDEQCKHEFLNTSIKIQSERKTVQGKALTRRYFSCPKCKRKYTIDVKDYKLRQHIKEFKAMVSKQQRMMRKKESPITLQNHINKMDAKSEIINDLQSQLRDLWNSNE